MKKLLTLLTFNFILFTVFAQTAEPILRLNLEMHNATIERISTDTEGKYILTTSTDKTAKLWDGETGELIRTYRIPVKKGQQGRLFAGAISPKAEIIAIGGITGDNKNRTVYIYNTFTGNMITALSGLTNYIHDIEFSIDGRYFAAALGANGGVVVYKTNLPDINNLSNLKIKKLKNLEGYSETTRSVAFSSTGMFASVCHDGKIRLYNNTFDLVKKTTGSGHNPVSIVFSPKGTKMAVGYSDVPEVEVRSGNNLEILYKPELGGMNQKGGFMFLTFSANGEYLYGAGHYSEYTYSSRLFVYRKWLNQGQGHYTDYREAGSNFFDIKSYPKTNASNNGTDFIYITGKPTFGRSQPESKYNKEKKTANTLFWKKAKKNNYNVLSNRLYLRINQSGDRIQFKPWYKKNVEFSVKERKLFETENTSGMPTYKTKQGDIYLTYSQGTKKPLMNGDTLSAWKDKMCKSVNVANNGKYAILSSGSYMNIYNDKNKLHGSKYTGSTVWEMNTSENSKILVAALDNGLINWYKTNLPLTFEIIKVVEGSIAEKYGLQLGDTILKVDGKEFYSSDEFISYAKGKKEYKFEIKRDNKILILNINKTEDKFGFTRRYKYPELLFSLYANPDNENWILYTPDGYFDCSLGAEKYAGWHVNQGADKEAKFYPLSQFYDKFYVPNLGARILAGEDITSDVKIKDIKLPPLVEITYPEDMAKVNKKELTITVKVTDLGGGIDEIRLYLNGKLVETTQRGFLKAEQKVIEKVKTFTISLANGENIIKATAFSNQRTESIADEVTVFYEGAKKTANLYMLVIGIDNYKNPRYKLNYALADATAFKEEIEKGSNGIFGSVNITYLKDADATRTRILQEFNKLETNAKQEDVFIFYYAGHGVMSEEDKPEFHIIPYDVTKLYGNNGMLKTKAISANELQTFSTELKAQKQMFIFDACQSGGMTKHLAARGAAEEKAISQLARSTGTYWLTASNSEQFATEFEELGHGLFTYCVLLGLQGQADGSNKDKKLTVKELSSFLDDKVPELSKKHKGSAQYPSIYGYGMDFPIIIVK